MHVICTAGHVDHGKSTLVRALTGIEPDRFEEERRRGLTIDIGFAWTTVADGEGGQETIAFVDLPGHERFIANMLAGAGAARLALFVVAADEGWMPQSSEHLAILDLLGVDGGVIAVTRSDLVDAETQELAVELVHEEVAGTALQDAPIVVVSATTGAGLDHLRSALTDLVRSDHPRSEGRPRLWVDRSFTVAGAGTVVTGTLTGGDLRVDDDVDVHPSGTSMRIRGLQQLQEAVPAATPGRVAINLAGVPRDAVSRGDVIVQGAWVRTGTIDAQVRSLGGRPLRRKGAWHLHVGSAERVVRIEPWTGDVGTREGGGPQHGAVEIGPRGGFARLHFEPGLPLQPGDAFVLREAGARETVGGGRVLDVRPEPRPRGRAGRRQRVAQLTRRGEAVSTSAPGALAAAVITERGMIADAMLDAEVGRTAAWALVDGVVRIGNASADPDAIAYWRRQLTAFLRAYHAERPLAAGAPARDVDEVLRQAGCPPQHVAAVESYLLADAVRKTGPLFHLPEHSIVLDVDQARARDRLLALLAEAACAPPDIGAAMEQTGASSELLRALENTGDLVRLSDRIVFARSSYDQAIADLGQLFATAGAFTTAEARERLATTRKYIIPLLEELDRRGITRRVGDRREVS